MLDIKTDQLATLEITQLFLIFKFIDYNFYMCKPLCEEEIHLLYNKTIKYIKYNKYIAISSTAGQFVDGEKFSHGKNRIDNSTGFKFT